MRHQRDGLQADQTGLTISLVLQELCAGGLAELAGAVSFLAGYHPVLSSFALLCSASLSPMAPARSACSPATLSSMCSPPLEDGPLSTCCRLCDDEHGAQPQGWTMLRSSLGFIGILLP